MLAGLSLALHNFPEGIATFAETYTNMFDGIALECGIAIHNIPEGEWIFHNSNIGFSLKIFDLVIPVRKIERELLNFWFEKMITDVDWIDQTRSIVIHSFSKG